MEFFDKHFQMRSKLLSDMTLEEKREYAKLLYRQLGDTEEWLFWQCINSLLPCSDRLKEGHNNIKITLDKAIQ